MSFLNLWALWIAAAVVPALLILYFLKLRRREEVVSSTLLWKRAVQDLQVNAPFQRLRKNLLLLLQLLVLAAAIFALARPIVQTTGAVEGRLVLLIDHSASMNATEGNKTRLDLAKEQAVRLVKTLNRRSGNWLSFLRLGGAETKTQAMVVAFADRATVISPFTPNTTDLIDAIQNIAPTDEQTHIKEALAYAEAYMAPPTRITQGMEDAAKKQSISGTPISAEAPAKVVLISDGAVEDLSQVVVREGTIELIKIGQTNDNVGITALRTQRNYEHPEILNAFLQVQNFGDRPVSCDVSLFIDGTLANTPIRTIALAAAEQPRDAKSKGDAATSQPAEAPKSPEATTDAPVGSSQGLSFELPLDRAAVVEARLSRDDALSADNRAFAAVPPPRRLRVLVVTEKNFFLDSVLRGLPLAERVFLTPAEYGSKPKDELEHDGQSRYDVVIFDKYHPGALPAGNYLFIGCVPPGDAVTVTGEFDQSEPLVWWDETSPILRHVALDYVYVGKGLVLKLPPEAQSLIEGTRGPVLARYVQGGRNYMILAFAVEFSNWWEKPSFPVFAYNALQYLGSGGAALEQGPTRPGDTLRILLPEGVAEAHVERPDGGRETVKPDISGVACFDDTQQAGLYKVRFRAGDQDRLDTYAVNLEDPWESNIRPRGAADLGRAEITPGKAIETSTPEVWRWFIGAALALVLFEWYVYNRRVMI